MFRLPGFDPPAVALGFGLYIAISGWLFTPPLGLLLSLLYGAALGEVARGVVGLVVFVTCGYVAGRVAAASPVVNAAAVAVVIYALTTAYDYAVFVQMAHFDLFGQLARLLRGVAAAAAGGLAAQWDMQRRNVGRFSVASLSRRARATMVALAIAPWLLLILSYRG